MEVRFILLTIYSKVWNILVSYYMHKYLSQYLNNFLLHENMELHICYKWYSDPDSFPADSVYTTWIRYAMDNVYSTNPYI